MLRITHRDGIDVYLKVCSKMTTPPLMVTLFSTALSVRCTDNHRVHNQINVISLFGFYLIIYLK